MWKCEAEGRCAWDDFTPPKKQKNANPCALGVQLPISVPKQTYIFSLDTSCLWYSIKCQTRRVPEVICTQRHTRTCMSRHNSRWLLDLSPKQSIVWVPGYHSFPKWAILYPRSLWDMCVLFDNMHKCFNFWIKVNRFDPQSGNDPYMPLCANSCVNEDTPKSVYRSFSHDVTVAIFVYKTMNQRSCLCTKQILWELNSFHMLKLSFISKQFAKLLTTWLKTISIVRLPKWTRF